MAGGQAVAQAPHVWKPGVQLRVQVCLLQGCQNLLSHAVQEGVHHISLLLQGSMQVLSRLALEQSCLQCHNNKSSESRDALHHYKQLSWYAGLK